MVGQNGSTDFYGMPVGSISNGTIRVDYLTQAGPRMVRLCLEPDGENLLAEAPDIQWKTVLGMYTLYGGHRIWHAPQGSPRSEIPDDQPVDIETLDGGVRLIQPLERMTGIQKVMEIRLRKSSAVLRVRHRLLNRNLWPVELSVWAISMLPLGGIAILPQPSDKRDADGLLPNRRIAYWTYTQVQDPRFQLDDRHGLLYAVPREAQWKIGYENTVGWIAYLRRGKILIKRFVPVPDGRYPDMGSNVEAYANDRFIELETLGELKRIHPGEEAVHEEEWEVRDGFPLREEIGIINQSADVRNWLISQNMQ